MNPRPASPPRPRDPPRPRQKAELARRGEARAEKFLEAALEVFLEKGYRQARVSDIVARAGGSYATLYRAYGDKEGLAHAIMERGIDAFDGAQARLLASDDLPEVALADAAVRMIEVILSPVQIVIHRIVIGEGLAFPALRDWYFEHGIRPAEITLVEYFRRQQEAGRLVTKDPSIAANRFYMATFARAILDSVAGYMTPADLPRVREEVREAVAIFLRGVLPR